MNSHAPCTPFCQVLNVLDFGFNFLLLSVIDTFPVTTGEWISSTIDCLDSIFKKLRRPTCPDISKSKRVQFNIPCNHKGRWVSSSRDCFKKKANERSLPPRRPTFQNSLIFSRTPKDSVELQKIQKNSKRFSRTPKYTAELQKIQQNSKRSRAIQKYNV